MKLPIFIQILLVWGIMCLPIMVKAQEKLSIKIDKIKVDRGQLRLLVKVIENGKLKYVPEKNKWKVTERVDNNSQNEPLEILGIRDFIDPVKIKTNNTEERILFLIDVSLEMTQKDINKSKAKIKEILTSRAANVGSKFFVSTYGEDINLNRKEITLSNIESVLSGIKSTDQKPDFYRHLSNEIRFMKNLKGSKSLFIFGSGKNTTNSEIYDRQIPYTCDDIEVLVNSIQNDAQIFAINYSNDEGADSTLACLASENTQFHQGDFDLSSIEFASKVRDALSNNLIQVIPKFPEFKGKERIYTVELENTTVSKTFRLGSINYPVNIQRKPSWTTWLMYLIGGIIAILLTLVYGMAYKPYILEKEFKKRHVEPYVPEPGRVRYDILTSDPIEAGELVVTKCRQITPFSTWKECGFACPAHPECMNQNCSGSGAQEPNSFSQLDGVFLKLNWILFGVIGGVLAWVIITFFRMIDFQVFNKPILSIVGSDFLNSLSGNNSELAAQTIGNNLLVGVAFGAGLMFMFSCMEERRTSNRYSIAASIGKIIFRTVIGILLSMVVFFIGFYLQYVIGLHPYLSGLISWILFGVSIGFTLSLYSTISVSNGIIGGVVGTFVAFLVYLGMSEISQLGFMFSNLLSMILMGGIMGSILVSVVTKLEDYELRILGPQGYQRSIPISKWIKSQVGVMIGKAPGSYIYVKWDDPEVGAEHAELFSENGNVFIRPIEEILLNGRLVANKPVELKNNDIIQLGRSSITQFKFVEK